MPPRAVLHRARPQAATHVAAVRSMFSVTAADSAPEAAAASSVSIASADALAAAGAPAPLAGAGTAMCGCSAARLLNPPPAQALGSSPPTKAKSVGGRSVRTCTWARRRRGAPATYARAESRSLTRRAMTRHAASCWYSACASSCRACTHARDAARAKAVVALRPSVARVSAAASHAAPAASGRYGTCSSCCLSEYVSSTTASHSFWNSVSSDGMLVAVGARGLIVLGLAGGSVRRSRRHRVCVRELRVCQPPDVGEAATDPSRR